MNFLYLATDVVLQYNNGGARRVYETARIFSKHGHKAIAFVDKGPEETNYQELDNIKIYRFDFPAIDQKLRKLGSDIKNLIFRFIPLKKDEKSKHKPIDTASNSTISNIKNNPYETYFGDTTPKTLQEKLIDLYRHKLPIHKFLKILPGLPKLLKIIQNEKIDVIIERGPSYGLGAFASLITNRHYIIDFIDIMYSNFALRRSDLILSYFTTHQIPRFINRNKIHKVWTVTDEKIFRPYPKDEEILSQYGLTTKDFICIYIGGMFAWHGLDIMVESAKLIREDSKNIIKFLFVGDGGSRKDIERLVEEKELDDRIIFTGKIPFNLVPKYLGCADVALSINTGDSVGFKLLEYMSTGTPIIATNADILHLVARNNKEALYVNINDPNDLKDKILYLYENPEIRKKMSKNARNRVVERYTWDKHFFNIINGIKTKISE